MNGHDAERTTSAMFAVRFGEIRASNLDPTRYVVTPYFPRGLVTLLGGHGGVGKTNLALIALAHIAADLPMLGLEVHGARCAFVSLEDGSDLVAHRLRRIADAYRIDQRRLDDVLIVDGSTGDPSLAEERNEMGIRRLAPTVAMSQLFKAVAGRTFIVIDNASDAFDGDENSRRQVRAFLRMLVSLARENDAAVVLLAHVDKSSARHGANGNSYSGSTAWHNSTRSRLAMMERDGLIEVHQEKLNVGRKADPLYFAWSDSGVLIPADRKPADEPATACTEDDAVGVLSAIRQAIEAGQPVPTARQGASTAFKLLSTFGEFPKALKQRGGKDRFWAAIEHLRRSGQIKAEVYTTKSRHESEKWVPALNARNALDVDSEHSAHERMSPALNARNQRVGVIGGMSARDCAQLSTCPRCAGEGCAHCRKAVRLAAN